MMDFLMLLINEFLVFPDRAIEQIQYLSNSN